MSAEEDNAKFEQWVGGPLKPQDVREFHIGVWGHHDYMGVDELVWEFVERLSAITGDDVTLSEVIERDAVDLS